MRTFQLSAVLLGLATILVGGVLLYQPERAVASALMLGTAILAVVLAPGTLGVLSWSAGIPIFYAVFFLAFPLLNRAIGIDDGSSDTQIAQALWVAAAGLLSFTVGTTLMQFLKSPRVNDMGVLRFEIRPPASIALIVIGGASVLWSYFFGYFGLITISGAEAGETAGLVSGFGFLLTVAHVMAWNAYFRHGRMLAHGVATTVLLCTAGLLANSKGLILLPIFLVTMCLWGVGGRFPYKLAVASLAVYVFLAFPLVTASRLAFATDISGSRIDLAQLVLQYSLSYDWIEDAANVSAVESLGRGLLPYFADIVEHAGNQVPFMDGKTFVQALEILVPRFLYPDKADMAIGNWTGQEFGAVAWDDDFTNVSPTYMGEFYMNFGLMGVCVGMLLIGMLATLVDRYLVVDRRSWTMPIMVTFIGWQESVVGHTMVPFIKNVAVWACVLLVLVYLVRANSRQLPAPNPRGTTSNS